VWASPALLSTRQATPGPKLAVGPSIRTWPTAAPTDAGTGRERHHPWFTGALAIQDPLTAGHQPMDSACALRAGVQRRSTTSASCGPILSARATAFAPAVDTEVLLQLLHAAMAAPPCRLRGMYAYCLLGPPGNAALLARDP